MKKILIVLFVSAFAFGLSACGSTPKPVDKAEEYMYKGGGGPE